VVDETEDETNPREFGGEVDAMSKIRETTQHIISKVRKIGLQIGYMLRRSPRLTAIFDVWRHEEVLLMGGVSV
jgi:acetylornithine/succinyldiaminopimelate/putrescine aminotransferase